MSGDDKGIENEGVGSEGIGGKGTGGEAADTIEAEHRKARGGIPNEKYCKRLIELAFPPSRKSAAAPTTVQVQGKPYSREELRAALEADPEMELDLRRRYRHVPDPADLEELLDVTFSPTFSLGDEEYTRDGLRNKLHADHLLTERLKKRYRHDGKDWRHVQLDELLDIAFMPKITIGTEEYTELGLDLNLPGNPKLQQKLATKVHFVPSKWLLEQELEACRKWSKEQGDVYRKAASERLTGVCFSGGGIRSATFNLGILQGMAEVGLLPYIDYLSSVSGGGYIHEFLAAWILRHPHGRQGVIDELIPQAEPGCLPRSPEPVKWLMRYSSYLTPMRGPFSTDTWTMIAIWFRNTSLNQVPILSGLAFAFLVVHLLVQAPVAGAGDFWKWHGARAAGAWIAQSVVGLVSMVFAVISLVRLGGNLLHQQCMHKRGVGSEAMTAKKLLTNADVQKWIILPWMAMSVWVTYWIQSRFQPGAWMFWAGVIPFCIWILATVMVVIFSGGAVSAYVGLHPGRKRIGWTRTGLIAAGVFAAAVACGFGWAFVLVSAWVSEHLSLWIGVVGVYRHAVQSFSVSGTVQASQARLIGDIQSAGDVSKGYVIDPWRIQLAVLPGLLLSIPYVGIETALGLLGRDFSDMRREWLARLRAWSVLYALLWFGLVSLALLMPYFVYWLAWIGPAAIWSAVATFLAAHGSILFAGWSGKADGKPTDKGIFGFKPLDLLALAAAPVTILGLLTAVSFGASWSVDHLARARWLHHQFWAADLVCCGVTAAAALVFGWRVDINEFSMQSFYRNRLTRCYLGASVPERQADPFTGFDGRAELTTADGRTRRGLPKLRELLPVGYTAVPVPKGREKKHEQDETPPYGLYEGPFPILCTTLNLTTGEDLATQERKGTSFAFTPLYSGYSVSWTDAHRENKVSYNGYVATEEYAYSEHGISLDTAVAISGAAMNPNMGYNSNPALAFLMTFFNVRLGWWISNPRKQEKWPAGNNRPTPTFAALYLFRELFGKVNDAAPYVNLSDGGHFENMGLYELVRRRCRYIVVCDAEEDREMTFEGMGAAITKCRADFGAEIDLDLRPLQKQADTGYSKAHCVVGTIQYPPPPRLPDEDADEADKQIPCKCLGDADDDPYTGVIVYIKSSLVGDEPPDLLTYQLKHAVFPQDSTTDQWFQETQFEAYRRLGHHVAMATFPPALSPTRTSVENREEIKDLFHRLYAIWYPRTPEMEKYLGDHLKQYEAILKELRERKELVGLEARLNDPTSWKVTEVVTWEVPEGDALAVLYPGQFANSLIDFMYTIYTDLQLAFPDNRVSPHAEWWICLFRRWCRVTLLRDAWGAHIAGYPLEFQLFARRELNLPKVDGYVE
jgi:hypothetical protein